MNEPDTLQLKPILTDNTRVIHMKDDSDTDLADHYS